MRPKISFYGLVRDKDGNPKVSNPAQVPPEAARKLLTAEERKKLGIILEDD